jgi:ATP-dependent exoDNAse (exonuclease V) beta subunit
MKYQYPEMNTQTYNNQRWYSTPWGLDYPSITTVLAHTASEDKIKSLEKWRQSMGEEKADAYTKSRADHGTIVHLLAERYLKGENVYAPVDNAPISEEDIGAFHTLKLKLKKVEEVYGQEVALASKTLECAGRCDLIAKYGGKDVIIDFKTAGRIKDTTDIHDYKLQLCFYAIAHNEMFGTNINEGIVWMVSMGGFPQEFKVDLREHLTELKYRLKTFWMSI